VITSSLAQLLVRLYKHFKAGKRVEICVLLFVVALLIVSLSIGSSSLRSAGVLSRTSTSQSDPSATVTRSEMMVTSQPTVRPESTAWWAALQAGLVRGFLEIALVLPISIVLAWLASGVTITCRESLRDTRLAHIADRITRGRARFIAFLLVLLLLLVLAPKMLMQFLGLSLSIGFLLRYAKELFFSIALVAVATGVAWKLFAGKESLNSTLLALDHGEINQPEVEEAQQIHALGKWIQGDDVGWYELWEMVRFGGGLRPAARSAVKKELQHLEQTHPAGPLTAKRVEQLQRLLSYHQ